MTTTIPLSPGAGGFRVDEAAQAACRSDYATVQSAVDTFEAETGVGPSSITQLQPLVHGPVVTAKYSITIDRDLAGAIDVATPHHRATLGESNCMYAGQ